MTQCRIEWQGFVNAAANFWVTYTCVFFLQVEKLSPHETYLPAAIRIALPTVLVSDVNSCGCNFHFE